MSIGTPASPVNAGEHPSDPKELPRAVRDALPRTKFYRALRALHQAAEAFHERVETFTEEHETGCAGQVLELARAGIITLDPDRQPGPVREMRRKANTALKDANGFLWVLGAFVDMLDSHLVVPDLDDETASGDDDAPRIVTGGKAVQ